MPCRACRGPKHPLPPIPDWLGEVRDYASAVCSIVCLAQLSMRSSPMEATEEQKNAAVKAASKAAGEYITHIRTFNFKHMTRDQWLRLLRIIAETYAGKLREFNLEDDIPF